MVIVVFCLRNGYVIVDKTSSPQGEGIKFVAVPRCRACVGSDNKFNSQFSRSIALKNLHAGKVFVATIAILTTFASAALAADDEKESIPKKPKWDVNRPPSETFKVPLDVRTGTWMSVAVSPDGKQIVFDLLGDLYLLPIEGGEAKALTHSVAWEMQARFSPDGKRLTYMSDAGGGDNIWVMNIDGSNAHEVSKEKFRLLNNPV